LEERYYVVRVFLSVGPSQSLVYWKNLRVSLGDHTLHPDNPFLPTTVCGQTPEGQDAPAQFNITCPTSSAHNKVYIDKYSDGEINKI
jgi:hypothetical protein